MKRLTSLVAAAFVLAVGISTAQAVTLYWDDNANGGSSTPGLIDPANYADGNWDTTSTQWTTSALGDVATQAWVDGTDDAVFRVAGAAVGLTTVGNPEEAIISVSAPRTASTVTFDTGYIGLSGTGNIVGTNGITINSYVRTEGNTVAPGTYTAYAGVLDSGANALTINAGGTLSIASTSRLNGAGKIVLNGGQLIQRNPGSAGTFTPTAKTIEVSGIGYLGYSDGNAGLDNQVSIYSGTITGTGGTTTNGGAGTLVVNGTDQFGIANNANMTFAKLVVDGGSYRLRNAGTVSDNTFGATPLAQLVDAITLKNNGAIGANVSVSFNAFRGVTIGTGGGRFSGIGLGTITIPGPLTSAGGNTLQIDGRNLTVASATYGRSGGGNTLTNANNTTTFVNTKINIDSSTLTLNESLNAAALSGASESANAGVGTAGVGNASAIATGTITVAASKTFTVGSNGASTSFAGRVTGSGNFTKVGAGELLLNTIPATETKLPTDPAYNGGTPILLYSGEWSNTGSVNINDGSIKFGNSNSGFATLCPVTIGATGKLNMNGINDTFGSLAGPAGAIVDTKDVAATPGNLTLGATTGITTYSGTIVGGGNFTKAGAASTATQILAGNTSLGTVTVSNGSLLTNAAMTTTGGVTVAAGATLGGTGSISGAIGNTGIIAPGASVGTLSVTGNVTDLAGSSWSIELSGATADKLAVTGNIDLSASDTLNVSGVGSGSSWLIGTYSGSLTGAFDTITPGYTVSYTGGNITLNAAAVGLPGDFNSDGTVDAQDYVVWRKRADGNPGTALPNDNGLGTPVGASHYALWRANFGKPPGAGSGLSGASVPEPTSICLVLTSLAFLGAGRRRAR